MQSMADPSPPVWDWFPSLREAKCCLLKSQLAGIDLVAMLGYLDHCLGCIAWQPRLQLNGSKQLFAGIRSAVWIGSC
uniref:Uncharacterized protein n=1 Tax=Tetraselmis sp. GSL018 TaxID=582737 RepID=A0A061QVU4_9CHLO